jgi:hypothetical protein
MEGAGQRSGGTAIAAPMYPCCNRSLRRNEYGIFAVSMAVWVPIRNQPVNFAATVQLWLSQICT